MPGAADATAPHVVAVATSGGRDSTALLHATVHAAAALGLHVVALHVNHGLQPQADAWQAQVHRQCARWARAGWPVSCLSHRLAGQPGPGQSVEAWARQGRYQALAQLARQAGATCVLLAHHRRDQGETVLLQALRGAGPAGLAAMPRTAERHGLKWCRPWLDQPDSALEHYIARWQLRHVQDPSNQDRRFARNRLRHDVWPALRAAFPDVEQALAHAARLAAQAAQLQTEMAQEDLARVATAPPGTAGPAGALRLDAWRLLSPPRQAGVLRAWLGPLLPRGVPDLLVTRLCEEWPRCPHARWPAGAGLELRAYRGVLRIVPASPPSGAAQAAAQRPSAGDDGPALQAPTVDLSRPGRYPLPAWRGTLEVRSVAEGGVATAALQGVVLKPRGGGERFQLSPGGIARSLKKQFQAREVPAWQRAGPLVWQGGELLFVPGLGLDARQLAPPGQPQRLLHWWPDPPQVPR